MSTSFSSQASTPFTFCGQIYWWIQESTQSSESFKVSLSFKLCWAVSELPNRGQSPSKPEMNGELILPCCGSLINKVSLLDFWLVGHSAAHL